MFENKATKSLFREDAENLRKKKNNPCYILINLYLLSSFGKQTDKQKK